MKLLGFSFLLFSSPSQDTEINHNLLTDGVDEWEAEMERQNGCLSVLSVVFNIFHVVDVDCLKLLRFPSLCLSSFSFRPTSSRTFPPLVKQIKRC